MRFQFDADYSRYSEVSLLPSSTLDIDQISLRYDLPFLATSLMDVKRLNEFVCSNLRGYALALVRSGNFSLTNPINGATCGVVNAVTLDDLSTLFFFSDSDRSFAVFASDLSQGFPITNLVIFEAHLVFTLEPTFWTLKARHFEVLGDKGMAQFEPLAEPRQICLVAGDSNFAHHAWNELSALEEIVALGLDANLPLYVFHEPLGPVNDILASSFLVQPKREKGEIYDLHGENRLTFAAGGQRITRSLLGKICAFAQDRADPALLGFLDELRRLQGESLWVSVRTRNRTMTNQTQVLAGIICAYLADRPRRLVVIDGHSLPFDHEDDPEFLRAINASVIADDHLTIEGIINAVRERLPEANIVTRCGDRIHESILIAQEIGLYFCHHGTVQHKVGWFASIPGVVHCNRKVLESRPAHWVADKSEAAVLPTYVPDEVIGVFEDFGYENDVQRNLNVENYFVCDISKLTDFFVDFTNKLYYR